MNIISEIRKILKLLGWSVDNIVHSNDRVKYPRAGYMPESMGGHSVLYIKGGMTALARWGLFEIIMHEMAHYNLKKRGYKNWKEHDEEFMREYFKIRKKYEKLINEYDKR